MRCLHNKLLIKTHSFCSFHAHELMQALEAPGFVVEQKFLTVVCPTLPKGWCSWWNKLICYAFQTYKGFPKCYWSGYNDEILVNRGNLFITFCVSFILQVYVSVHCARSGKLYCYTANILKQIPSKDSQVIVALILKLLTIG